MSYKPTHKTKNCGFVIRVSTEEQARNKDPNTIALSDIKLAPQTGRSSNFAEVRKMIEVE
jgi:hypothetical protein